MEDMIEELDGYYRALGYPMYTKEYLEQLCEEELQDLYDITFPNHD